MFTVLIGYPPTPHVASRESLDVKVLKNKWWYDALCGPEV